MSEDRETVRVRLANRSIVEGATRLPDGRLFIPVDRIEEGDEIEVEGEEKTVARLERHELSADGDDSIYSKTGLVETTSEGYIVTFEDEQEG